MIGNLVLQCLVYVVVLLVLAKPLGEFFARVLAGERTFLTPALGWLERLTYKASGVDAQREMRWTEYATETLIFNLVGLLAVYAIQRLQGALPLNPAGLGAVSPNSSFNTAVSFATNTNWQGYGGESTMSYFTWGPSHVEHTHYLRIYIKQLRDKLEADPVQPKYLLTETGIGYRLIAEEG